MAISDRLLKILVDPLSKQALSVVEHEGRERLHCESNGLYYRVEENDIPVLLIEEAELEDGSPATELVEKLMQEMTTDSNNG